MNENEQDKLKWWAQQLMQAYVRLKKERDRMFKELPVDWNDESKWSAMAEKLIEWGGQSSPTECMHILFGCSDKRAGPDLFMLDIILSKAITKSEFAAHDLNKNELKQMRSFNLNPESIDDLSLFKIMAALIRYKLLVSRAAGTEDVKSREFIDKVCLNFFRIPAWAAYAFNPGDPEIAANFRVQAENYYRLHPDTGDALIRLGCPKEIIFPQGHPCG